MNKLVKRLQIGVIGSAGPEEYPKRKPLPAMMAAAEQLGALLAQAGCIVVNGGKGGVMEAVCKGAKSVGGLTVAEIAGTDRGSGNRFVDIEIITADLGFRGPSLLVGMSDGLISLGGGAGTLQELAVAYRMQKPVVLLTGFGGWTDRLAQLDFLDERQLVAFTKTNRTDQAVAAILNLLQ